MILPTAEIFLRHEGIGEGNENCFAVAFNGDFQQIAGAVVWHGDELSQFRAILQDHIKAHEVVGVGFVGFEFWKFLAGDEKFNAFQRLCFVAIAHVLEARNEIILRGLELGNFKLLAG